MRSEEFISKISNLSEENEKFEQLRAGIPLGVDVGDNVVLARKKAPLSTRHLCVTGSGKTNFIRRTLITLSCLYEKQDASFLIISPKAEYGELLRLHSLDAVVPYIRLKSDFTQAIETVKELIRMRADGKTYPKLFLVLDGIEELEGCNNSGDLEEYHSVLELVARRQDVEVINGIDLVKSIFSGYPGAFVGIGNCLVTTREVGTADVTYVNDDSSLSPPTVMHYPSAPSVMETVIFLNSIQKETGETV